MKTLLILRHAKSSWKDDSISDHQRPLNGRGKRDAPRIGRLIVEQELHPDLILSSTANRAKTTVGKVIEGGELACPMELVDDFYLAHPETYVAILQRQADDDRRILVVGHNPGLEDLVELLTGSCETLPTAALVHIDLDIESWRELSDQSSGLLRAVWRPKELE